MGLRFTNTLGGKKEAFEPLAPGRATIYVCGPTVYGPTHVGHARSAVAFDVLRRHLLWRGFDVLFVRNITDIDDKIIAAAKEQGIDTALIAERYTREYEDALRALNVLPPDVAPRATGHIIEMIDLIEKLVDCGYAYPGEGSVYFAVEKLEGYGKLSGRGLDELANRERVEPAPGKHHPLDFALWKAAKPAEPAWPSPWGPGRPGWHIECSVMSSRYLGQPFDIHGGGADLIFPHHENEIAQSEACDGTPFAKYWLHNGFVTIRGDEMHKSAKNYIEVKDAIADYGPQVLRLLFSGAHYRSQVDFGPRGLDEAKAVWERFRAFFRVAPHGDAAPEAVREKLAAFGAAMDDDLNTPAAIAALHEIATEGHAADANGASLARAALEQGLGVVGVPLDSDRGSEAVGPLVELLLEQREEARAAKDFAKADEIRDKLTAIGVQIEDSAQGPRWFLA